MDYFKDIDRLIESFNCEDDYISTGFPWLDSKLGGGFLALGRAIYIYSGATNSGKSIMLGNTATSAVNQGKNTVVITMEMSEDIYAERISGQLSRIPIRELKEESSSLKSYCDKFLDENDNRLFIKEFPNNTIKVSAKIGRA